MQQSVRTVLTIIGMLSLLSVATYAQSGWERVGPVSFTGMVQVSPSHLLVCTDAGSVYESTDAGSHWTHRLITPRRSFASLSFAGADTGVIGASGGAIEITTDGGKHWTERPTGIRFLIGSVSMPTANHLYAASFQGHCLRSTDLGISWDTLPLPSSARLTKVSFVSSELGYVSDDSGRVFRTVDAGAHWNALSPPLGQSVVASISDLSVSPDGSRIAVSSGALIATTTDAGATWHTTDFSTIDTLNFAITLLRTIGRDTLLAFAISGSYRLRSTDYGATWTPIRFTDDTALHLSSAMQLKDMCLLSNGDAIAVGTLGTVYQLRDYGRRGTVAHHCPAGIGTFPFAEDDVTIEPLSGNPNVLHAYCTGATSFDVSTDGGTTWYATEESSFGHAQYFGLHFSSASDGVLFSALQRGTNRFPFVATSDNGRSWRSLEFAPQVSLISSSTDPWGNIYVYGDSSVFVSADNGHQWSPLFRYAESAARDPQNRSILNSRIYRIQFMPDSTAYMLVTTLDTIQSGPASGALKNTTTFVARRMDGSITTRFPFPDSLVVLWERAHFVTTAQGFVLVCDSAFANGRCLRTSDGGASWSIVPEIRTPSYFVDLVFNASHTLGLLLGAHGEIFLTLDSGRTWSKDSVVSISSLASTPFHRAFFIDDSSVMLTSQVGMWKKTFHSLPLDVRQPYATLNPYLYITTYPSPAVGSTVHLGLYGLYSMKNEYSMSLKLYDLLGRQVRDLTGALLTNYTNGKFANVDLTTDGLQPGVYLLILAGDTGGCSSTILVVH